EISPGATIFRYGIVPPELIGPLRESGAVANVLCQFIDAEGDLIEHEINRRIMAIELEAVARLPHVVLAAGGTHKVPAMLAALKSVRANVVITDASTAKLMLARAETDATGSRGRTKHTGDSVDSREIG
ncbi:MAG TPA: sugar-binding domain-containing protein, partial [Pararhizobium sp.]|nr:sugar-binding domain-containing protein [Pararhizobium sp.]